MKVDFQAFGICVLTINCYNVFLYCLDLNCSHLYIMCMNIKGKQCALFTFHFTRREIGLYFYYSGQHSSWFTRKLMLYF
jgi:hypothetical protein